MTAAPAARGLNMTLAKVFGAASIPVGGSTSLTFTAHSSANVTGAVFTDTLPAGLVVATPNAVSGSCGGGTITAIAGSSTISLAGAAFAAGASCTFAVNVVGTAVGLLTNTTSAISSTGGAGLPATASITVTAAVPVMGPVALVLFALLLAGSAALLVRRRAVLNT